MRATPTDYLIIALLQRFGWVDEGLQARLRAKNWPNVSRPQSMVMINIASGVTQPSKIARNLGISRQAVHNTINQMVKMDMIALTPDPEDGRHMIASITETGAKMREDAHQAMVELGAQLTDKLGEKGFTQLIELLQMDWGSPLPDTKKAQD